MDVKMIKTIIFDLNRVLITFKDINKEYQEIFGITQKEFWKPMKNFFGNYTIGKTNLDQVLLNILEENKLDKSKLLEAKILHEKNFSQISGMNGLLKSLKRNYSLILAAGDGKESLEMKFKKFDLKPYFSHIYATCYMKIMKTNPDFYQKILYENNINSKETIFIDDRKSHLDVAEKLNINTILFENLPKLKRNLKEKFNIAA